MWSNVIAVSEKEETSPESASSALRQSAIRSCIGNQLQPVMVRVRVGRFDIEYNQNEILLSCRARLSSLVAVDAARGACGKSEACCRRPVLTAAALD
jgi:hypothetical protein